MAIERSMDEMSIGEVVLANLKMVLPPDWDKVCVRTNITYDEDVISTTEYWVAKKNRTTMVHCSNSTSDNVSKDDIAAVCSLITEYMKGQSERSCTYTFIFEESGKSEIKYDYHDNNNITIF